MIRYCRGKWYKNMDLLEAKLRDDENLSNCDYKYLVKMIVDVILNDNKDASDYFGEYRWDSDKITEIDNGNYQGTLLYLIPRDTYQPSEYEYLMTYVGYGSCSGCDTLQHIQMFCDYDDEACCTVAKPTERALKDFMALCKDIVANMVKPYNCGWRNEADFEPVVLEETV